jgi:hypothetical protein
VLYLFLEIFLTFFVKNKFCRRIPNKGYPPANASDSKVISPPLFPNGLYFNGVFREDAMF